VRKQINFQKSSVFASKSSSAPLTANVFYGQRILDQQFNFVHQLQAVLNLLLIARE